MEIGAFVVVVLVGLGFTTALMYMLTSWVRLPGIPAKLLTIAIVMTWNFLGRCFFVFKPDLPAGTAAFSTRLLERFAEKHHRDKEEKTQDAHSLPQDIVVPKFYHYTMLPQ